MRFSRRNLLATLVGVLLAGLPMSVFNFWLDELIERQGQEEVAVSARRTITLAESRIARVTGTLDDLASRGVDSCRPSQIELLRKAAFDTTPAKELSVIGPDGQTLCTDAGIALGPRRALAAQPISPAGDVWFEVMRLGNPSNRVVRIRRQAAGRPGLAALIPTELFIPQVSTQGGALNAHALVTMRDGTVVGEGGNAPGKSVSPANIFTRSILSNRYGLTVQVSLPRAYIAEGQVDLHALGLVVTGGIALVIAIFALLVPWRQRENPITEIERALQAGEFIPYYQPIVDITSGRLRGAEVLLRWRKPDGSLIGPGAFIPLAESSGVIVEMTRSLMRMVRDEVGEAYRERPMLRIAINLAARHFIDEDIVQDVRDVFSGSPIRLSQLVLEVTERQQLENLTAARQVIAALQGLGVKVAIDDVGAGHSGLSYMLKLGVDVIKVDKIFIDALGNDTNSTAIIDTLVDLARSMRMDIIAEGVENFEQVIFLREHGIRAAQGYVFAPPLPGSAFLTLLDAIDPLTKAPVATTVGDIAARERLSAA